MPERPNGAVSKTVVSRKGHRGFKSHSLRHAQGGQVPIGLGRRRRARVLVTAFLVPATVVAIVAGPGPAGAAKSDARADRAIQKQAVLKKADLPAGWTSSPRREAEPSTAPACTGIEQVNADLRPRATRSPDFSRSDTTLVNNSVVLLKSTKEAKRLLAVYRAPEAVACLEAVVVDAFSGPGLELLGVDVYPVATTPGGANEAAGFDMQVTVTATPAAGQPAQTLVLYWDLVVVRVGRALTNFAFLNPSRSLPEKDELVDVVVGRLQDAL